MACGMGRAVIHFSDLHETALTFDKDIETRSILFGDDGISFPMTKFGSIIDGDRPLINANSIGDMRALMFFGISFKEAFSMSASEIFS